MMFKIRFFIFFKDLQSSIYIIVKLIIYCIFLLKSTTNILKLLILFLINIGIFIIRYFFRFLN